MNLLPICTDKLLELSCVINAGANGILIGLILSPLIILAVIIWRLIRKRKKHSEGKK